METFKSFSEKLFNEKSVAIFAHMRPDGDTVGSCFALYHALIKKGIDACVFCSDKIPKKYDYLAGIFPASNFIDKEYSAFLAVDCASIDRLGDFSGAFSIHKNTYNLDHHISNDRFAKTNLVVNSASNAENVYEVLLEVNQEITEEIANFLALGVITDTGNFKHKNVTPETLLVASKLLEKGADFNKTVYQNFSVQSKERAKLYGLCMSKLRYLLDDRLCVLVITAEDFAKTGALPEETEGFIDFIMGIDIVEVGVSIMETDKRSYKVSFRSKETNVNEIAGVFGGGGHVQASGCRISGELEDVIDRIRYAVKQHVKD